MWSLITYIDDNHKDDVKVNIADAYVTVVYRIVEQVSKVQEPCFAVEELAKKRIEELLNLWDGKHSANSDADKFFYRPQYSVVPEVAFVFDGMIFAAGYHSLGNVSDIVGREK